MLKSLFRQLHEAGVAEYAAAPIPVDSSQLPHWATERRRPRHSSDSCPIGLVRATVLDSKAHWVESYSTGCGDTLSTHDIPHTTGVLVSISQDDLSERQLQSLLKSRHADSVENEDGKFLHLVVSHKVLFSRWTEYEPVKLERERLARESEERYAHLGAVADRLGVPASQSNRTGLTEHELDGRNPQEDARHRAEADFIGDLRRWRNSRPTEHAFTGYVTLPYSLAVRLADELDAAGERNEQGELA